MVNYYDLLQVNCNANVEEIVKAYKEKAKLYHPDVNAGSAASEALFKLVGQAKEILSDEVKRLEYDYAVGIKKRPEPEPKVMRIPQVENKRGGSGGEIIFWAALALFAGIAIGGSGGKRGS
jgi:DnaJ-class molecular chaperone